MQFREVTWAQQLHFQRLLHGPGAEVTERSLPNYPGTALREIIRQSGHPHNVEPLLLTLRRPANAAMRRRFGEVAGELVLLEKVTSDAPVATDFQVAMHGQVSEAADGILYAAAETTTRYEVWLRAEMLDVLRLMIEERLVASLVPEMQLKLVADMLRLAADEEQHELIRLYAFSVALAAVKTFHAARPAALSAGFAASAAAFLRFVLAGQQRPEGSVLRHDPCEQLKGLVCGIEGLYLAALTNQQTGDMALPSAAASVAAGADSSNGNSSNGGAPKAPLVQLDGLQRQLDLSSLQADGGATAEVLAAAVERLWGLLAERDGFSYTPPAPSSSSGGGDGADGAPPPPPEGETEAQAAMRKAAEEAVAAANLSFEDNWASFLKTVYDTQLVPSFAFVGLQLGCALLQLLAHAAGQGVGGGGDKAAGAAPVLPRREVLQQLASYKQDPLLATTGCILLAMAGGSPPPEAAGVASGGVDATTAILALPGHEALELREFGKACHACGKAEGADGGGAKLLRCAACGVVFYCSTTCQKADWKAGHKGVCKQLAESRAKLAAASAGATSGSG